MNMHNYEHIASQLLQTALEIQQAKRPEYTIDSEDVLANFKRVAERAGGTVGQAWLTYFLKHIDAISAIMQDPHRVTSEPVINRFADALNYLLLGFAIYVEQVQDQAAPVLREQIQGTLIRGKNAVGTVREELTETVEEALARIEDERARIERAAKERVKDLTDALGFLKGIRR